MMGRLNDCIDIETDDSTDSNDQEASEKWKNKSNKRGLSINDPQHKKRNMQYPTFHFGIFTFVKYLS